MSEAAASYSFVDLTITDDHGAAVLIGQIHDPTPHS
jgi:hypothetical protein